MVHSFGLSIAFLVNEVGTLTMLDLFEQFLCQSDAVSLLKFFNY